MGYIDITVTRVTGACIPFIVLLYIALPLWLLSSKNVKKVRKKKKEVGDIQKTTQFTVSEIIGFLNEFETPSWVFERMFQQSDMYYFKETELVPLETEVSDKLATHYEKSEKFISDFAQAFAEVSE